MKILIANQKDVRNWLPMSECIDAVADVLMKLAKGEAENPDRNAMWLPNQAGILGMMPANMVTDGIMGMKSFSVLPSNIGTEYDAHQGFVLLFETKHGAPIAVMDASEITAIRTAAASAVATKLLSRPESNVLTILGSGVQAQQHLSAMMEVRPIDEVRVWSRNADNAVRFCERNAALSGVKLSPIADAKTAVDGADIVCTTTWSPEPVLFGDWLAPGMHINGVGASVPFMRELDTNAVVKSRLFVERRKSTITEAGDFLMPQKEGAIDETHIQGELAEIMLGQNDGRCSDDEITLYKSLGIALQDVAAAEHIYAKMEAAQAGLWVDFSDTKEQDKPTTAQQKADYCI